MDYLTVQEIAEILKVSDQTIYNLIKEGKLKAIQVGNLWRVEREEYLRFIGKNKNDVVRI